ncbi:GyrI-like domain-containing protein [Kaistia dalseonensis]|uniref:Effector-binding domain-containing protein n=1 Tax=Kaistia dalseonensis TaxID=410840 RepID=A0ABU0H5Z4_9HYPH|nr:GyrI-like domain-containing protein [Kaistia dalseonensis]MCX5495155.1 GyrI-like domain-containing protein [Kaistia dalseonensis]MDQ0437738.1 effector-binding domain-containing protein [Kaistia dalseonensis]
MLTLPEIVERSAQPYLAIAVTTTMDDLSTLAPKTIDALMEHAAMRGIDPAGPIFFKYDFIRMPDRLEIEVGFPTTALLAADETVRSGMLPAGRFATVTYRGPYDGLYDANAVLIGWAKERGLRWDVETTPSGDRFGCRLEIYVTDPVTVPDPKDWETELAIRLAA